MREKLEEERREKEWAKTWKPDGPGDMLIGTFEGMETADTDFGECRIAHIRTEDGVLRALWLRHSVLQDEWNEEDPDVGDRLGAVYHGQREGENFRYYVWSVAVE